MSAGVGSSGPSSHKLVQGIRRAGPAAAVPLLDWPAPRKSRWLVGSNMKLPLHSTAATQSSCEGSAASPSSASSRPTATLHAATAVRWRPRQQRAAFRDGEGGPRQAGTPVCIARQAHRQAARPACRRGPRYHACAPTPATPAALCLWIAAPRHRAHCLPCGAAPSAHRRPLAACGSQSAARSSCRRRVQPAPRSVPPHPDSQGPPPAAVHQALRPLVVLHHAATRCCCRLHRCRRCRRRCRRRRRRCCPPPRKLLPQRRLPGGVASSLLLHAAAIARGTAGLQTLQQFAILPSAWLWVAGRRVS